MKMVQNKQTNKQRLNIILFENKNQNFDSNFLSNRILNLGKKNRGIQNFRKVHMGKAKAFQIFVHWQKQKQ